MAHLYIVNPFKGQGMTNLFSTHPPIEERVRRLRAMAGLALTCPHERYHTLC